MCDREIRPTLLGRPSQRQRVAARPSQMIGLRHIATHCGRPNSMARGPATCCGMACCCIGPAGRAGCRSGVRFHLYCSRRGVIGAWGALDDASPCEFRSIALTHQKTVLVVALCTQWACRQSDCAAKVLAPRVWTAYVTGFDQLSELNASANRAAGAGQWSTARPVIVLSDSVSWGECLRWITLIVQHDA